MRLFNAVDKCLRDFFEKRKQVEQRFNKHNGCFLVLCLCEMTDSSFVEGKGARDQK